EGVNRVRRGAEMRVLAARNENGPKAYEFAGLDSAPVGLGMLGLKIVLRAERPRSIRANTPVHYRGVEVGVVQNVELAPNATSADVHVLIYERYAGLVRQGSAFWDTSGVNVHGSLLKGVDVDIESLRAIATGGIEFATPSERRRTPSPARSSSCTTSRRRSGSPGCRGSRWHRNGTEGVRISSRAASPGARPSPSPSARGSAGPRTGRVKRPWRAPSPRKARRRRSSSPRRRP